MDTDSQIVLLNLTYTWETPYVSEKRPIYRRRAHHGGARVLPWQGTLLGDAGRERERRSHLRPEVPLQALESGVGGDDTRKSRSERTGPYAQTDHAVRYIPCKCGTTGVCDSLLSCGKEVSGKLQPQRMYVGGSFSSSGQLREITRENNRGRSSKSDSRKDALTLFLVRVVQIKRTIEENKEMVTQKIKGGRAMTSPVVRSGNVLKENALRFAPLLVALASSVAAPNAALTQAPQHHDQVPGFYRQKVGDLEVTALFDGHGVFDLHWLNGTKATMDGVVEALNEDPRLLDVSDEGFLVNTGKQLILVDAGAGTWWGGGALGRLLGSLRSAGYTPEEVDLVLVTHLHSDHVGGLTTQDGKRVFSNADVYLAKAESDFWLSPEIAAKAPKAPQPFFRSAQAIAAPYIKAGKWHTFSGSETIVDGMQFVPLPGHTPGHTGYEVSSKGQKTIFCAEIVHTQHVQLQHPEVTAIFDIDQNAAAATRLQLLLRLVREHVLIAGPHIPFPALGSLP